MENTPQLRDLKRKLLQRGLSRKYVQRILTELSEHAGDCDADGAEEKMIGDIDGFADQICAKLKNSTFTGRHPALSYIFLPTIFFAAIFFLTGFGLLFLVDLLIDEKIQQSRSFSPVAYAIYYALKYFLPLFVAAAFCLIARKSFCGFKWGFIACLSLTIFTAPLAISITPPVADIPASGTLCIGLGLPYTPRPDCPPPTLGDIRSFLKNQYLAQGGLWHFIPILTFCFYYLLSLVKLRKDAISD